MIKLYKKKPLVVEAIQFLGKTNKENLNAIIGGFYPDIAPLVDYQVGGESIKIHTLEGTVLAEPGDWIVRGVKGEFYPVKDEVFKLTYEPAE